MKPNFDGIPQELKELNQWCLWKLENDDHGKPTKRPYQPNNKLASTTDKSTWSSYKSVCESFDNANNFNGIGFILSEDDPYCFIDLDHCLDDQGNVEQWAYDVLQTIQSYPEKSQSYTGIHIIAKGFLPENSKHKKNGFEVYTDKRYCALTGYHLTGFPITIESKQKEIEKVYSQFFPIEKSTVKQKQTIPTNLSDAEIINKLNNAKNKDKFKKLFYNGDCSDYPKDEGESDQSSGDLALVSLIAFYTKDKQQILSIIQQSALYDKKWERQDYQDRTINYALSDLSETYQSVRINQPENIATKIQPLNNIELPSFRFPLVENQLCNEYMSIMDSVTEAPKSYHFFTFITCVGMLLARNAFIQWGMDRIYPNIWTMIVGQTGRARKSSTINKGRDIISKIAPDINVIPMIATWEGLLSAMSRTEEDIGLRNEVTLVCMPEFDGFLKKTRQDQISHLLPYLCDLFDCPDEARNTTKGSPLCVKNPFFSILAGIQPEVLSKSFQSNDVNGGFAGRFMYVNDSSDKSIPIPIWDKQTEYNKILGELAVIRANYNYVHQVKLDNECIPFWNEFYNKYRNATDNSLLLQLNDRMQIHVLKMSMIFACLENKEFISKDHLRIAIDIGYWLIDNNAKLFGTIGISEKTNIELKIMETLRNNPTDKRSLHLSFNGRISSSDFNSAIEGLIKATMIRAKSVKNPRGKPTTVLELCE